jgi:hypothetical protein
VALEDRDWYRNEASNAWWREADGASRRPSSAGGGRGRRTSVGLLLAVLVSGLVSVVAWQGYLPAIKISGGSAEAADERTVRLGSSTGFDVVGPVGRQWCLTVRTGERVCAKTGTAETGRQALTRVLESRGYRVK